jgi:hypothetical protein
MIPIFEKTVIGNNKKEEAELKSFMLDINEEEKLKKKPEDMKKPNKGPVFEKKISFKLNI